MTQDMWKLFPRLIEQKINGLLDLAIPNRMKSYQLYKTCQNESLFRESFSKFNLFLEDFFSRPERERCKSQMDALLDRPMHKTVYELFKLDFRSADIEPTEIHKISTWAHNMIRLNCTISDCLITTEVLDQTLGYVTHPPVYEKASDIEFEDFCSAWKRIIFQFFGHRYDDEVNRVLVEMYRLNIEQKNIEKAERFMPLISLTQTEIDWVLAVQKATVEQDPMPSYPLMRGPQKPMLVQLERLVQLYNIVNFSQKPELVAQRPNVVTTLLYRCEELMHRRAK